MPRSIALAVLVLAAGASAQPRSAPIEIEAGVRMGPIRIGMSLADLRGLGLTETDEGSVGRRFGPYLVQLDDHGVRRIEAQLGALGAAVRIGGERVDVGTDIHEIRDRIGSCQWQEGGGEIYSCANGTLIVRTTHSLAPERYSIAVVRPRE